MKRLVKATLTALLVPSLLLAGCGGSGTDSYSSSSSSKPRVSQSVKSSSSSQISSSNAPSSSFSSAPAPSSSSSSSQPSVNLNQADSTEYPSQARSDVAIAPIRNQVGGSIVWNGHGAYTVNNNQPGLGQVSPYGRPWAQNQPQNQGRAVQGDAYLTKQSRQYRGRSQTGNGVTSWKPVGYMQQFNLPGQYRMAYNRGHLLGYALVGSIPGFNASESNPQNIATQTMWANQAWGANNTGQNYYEGIVRKALDQNKFVRYQVKDLYSGNEQVPRATQIKAQSSDGSISFNVLIPNAQNNIQINYQNGQVTPCSNGGLSLENVFNKFVKLVA